MAEVLAHDADAVGIFPQIEFGGAMPELMSGDPGADMPPCSLGDRLREGARIHVAAIPRGEKPWHPGTGPIGLPGREVVLDHLHRFRHQREPERLAVLDLLRGQLDQPAGVAPFTEPADGLADSQVDQVADPHAAGQQ